MQQPRFRPKRIPDFSRKLVIGTSRTKYIDPRTVGSSIHSFRGATLVDLYNTLKHYDSKQLESVTVIAGFNDHQANRHEIVYRWQKLIELIVEKFNPKRLIIPKTIGIAQNSHIKTKSTCLTVCFLTSLQIFTTLMFVFSPPFSDYL